MTDLDSKDQEEIHINPCGWQIAIKLHLKPHKVGSIVIPDTIRDNEKYRACVGKVVGVGPDAFKGERFASGPWCKIGDYVTFPRHEGTQLEFKGHPVHVINDDRVLFLVEDPNDVVRS